MNQDLHENELRLYLENIKGQEHVRIRIRGDGATIAQMLAHAAEARSDIFAMLISATAGVMEQKGWSTLDLKKFARGSGINI